LVNEIIQPSEFCRHNHLRFSSTGANICTLIQAIQGMMMSDVKKP